MSHPQQSFLPSTTFSTIPSREYKSWSTYPGYGEFNSPVYTLAVGPFGKSVYAGTRGCVWDVDFWGRQNARVGKEEGVGWTMYEWMYYKGWFIQGSESLMGRAGERDMKRLDARWRYKADLGTYSTIV
jgi:hypothetical protein